MSDLAQFKSALGRDDIGIYRTVISGLYAVSVDAGDNRSLALDIVQQARTVGEEAIARIEKGVRDDVDEYDLKHLSGAFIQVNKGWYVDKMCK
jgi:hypothetical protein